MKSYRLHKKELYYRLVSLWVVCEAFAGGLMHASKIPFTGMIVSSLAVTCIISIAYYAPSKTNIIKATLTVAVFKFLLSPHSPPTAYIALFFQGYLGHLLFCGRRHFTLSAVILSVLALVESAIQRLLVLLIVYGNTFWHAADIYIKKLVGGDNRSYSLMIASGYIFLHAVVGISVGIYAVRLLKASALWSLQEHSLIFSKNLQVLPDQRNNKRKRKLRLLSVMLWFALLFFFVQANIDPVHAVLPKNDAFLILLRVVLIMLTWHLIIGPIIMKYINRRLSSVKHQQQADVYRVMQLLPEIKYILIQSWVVSGTKKGLRRSGLFLKILLINIISEEEKTIC